MLFNEISEVSCVTLLVKLGLDKHSSRPLIMWVTGQPDTALIIRQLSTYNDWALDNWIHLQTPQLSDKGCCIHLLLPTSTNTNMKSSANRTRTNTKGKRVMLMLILFFWFSKTIFPGCSYLTSIVIVIDRNKILDHYNNFIWLSQAVSQGLWSWFVGLDDKNFVENRT